MTDKEYAPLTVVCVRALNDKLYEKRKGAALEIERMMKEFVSTSNIGQIQKLLKVLGQDFALSQSPNSRKGGLIGLAACAIGLGKEASHYVTDLVKPVLACFSDSDSRVRYYGCESLYNIVKVARGSVLPFFNDIFDGLSKLTADPDQNVRSGSDLLDRLMKDIVTESASFDLVAFIPMLRERIYTRNPFARQFLVSWVSVLDHVPDIDMLVFLPEILDGLFHILGDSNPEIRKMCEATLGEFLRNICKTERTLNFPTMANILILHSQSTDALIQLTAISWLKELILLSGRTMIPFTSGILTAVHPCLSYESPKRKNTREAAKAVNSSLMKLVSSKDDEDSATDEPSISSSNTEKPETEDIGPKETSVPGVSNDLLPLEKQNKRLDVASIVKVLLDHLSHDSMQTRIAALNWIFHLHIKTPNKVFEQMDTLFPKLLQTLSDPSDEVVLRNLEVLSEIASNPVGHNHPPKEDGDTGYELPVHLKKVLENSHNLSAHFSRFMVSLLRLFRKDQTLLDDRGPFIIRQLCLLLKAENIYRCCSEILQTEQDGKFAAHMIKTLSTILLTSTELFELRSQLKDLKTEESCSLFCGLYRSWCHNPVSTVALCLLTQNYQHACDLLAIFGDLEVTVDFLTEIDKLVQLLESPIFTYLRLQLLDVQNREYLIKSLYGLLMLLPQSDAFTILQRRLECVPQVHLMPHTNKPSSSSTPNKRLTKKINFQELLAHFKHIQEAHRAHRHQPRHIDDTEKGTTQV